MSQSAGITFREEFISLLSYDICDFSDCIVLLEGDGYSRINHACNLYKDNYAKKIIFSGGITDLKYGSFPFSMCRPYFIENGLREEDVILEDQSQNTREQANNIVEMCLNNDWNSIILVASHYHQYRAFLTFLKVLESLKLERKIKIHNSPALNLSWDQKNSWGKRIDLLKLEFLKIEEYKIKGHISEYEAAIKYLLWKQSSIKS